MIIACAEFCWKMSVTRRYFGANMNESGQILDKHQCFLIG